MSDIQNRLKEAYSIPINISPDVIGGVDPTVIFNKYVEKFGLVRDESNKIYYEGKELLWENILKHKNETILAFSLFRKVMVDTLIKYSAKESGCIDCYAKSVGSVTLKSDYDITIFGSKSWLIIEIFNKTFRALFGRESGETFDTNLYGTPFYEYVTTPYDYFKIKESLYGRYLSIVNQEADEKRQDINIQRVFSLIKIVENIDQNDINNINLKLNKLAKPYFNDAIKLYNRLISSIQDINNIQARNDKYVEELKKESMKRQELLKNPTSEKLQLSLKTAICTSNFYASEGYYTQGAFFHVVGLLQTALRIHITYDELLDSFFENIGDTLKIVKNDNLQDEQKCYSEIISSSKYLYRAINALLLIIKRDKTKLKSFQKIINDNTNNILNKIRTDLRQKTIKNNCEGDNVSCVSTEEQKKIINNFLIKFGTNCNSFRQYILSLFIGIMNIVSTGTSTGPRIGS